MKIELAAAVLAVAASIFVPRLLASRRPPARAVWDAVIPVPAGYAAFVGPLYAEALALAEHHAPERIVYRSPSGLRWLIRPKSDGAFPHPEEHWFARYSIKYRTSIVRERHLYSDELIRHECFRDILQHGGTLPSWTRSRYVAP